jgi:hypothetical protein
MQVGLPWAAHARLPQHRAQHQGRFPKLRLGFLSPAPPFHRTASIARRNRGSLIQTASVLGRVGTTWRRLSLAVRAGQMEHKGNTQRRAKYEASGASSRAATTARPWASDADIARHREPENPRHQLDENAAQGKVARSNFPGSAEVMIKADQPERHMAGPRRLLELLDAERGASQ